MSLTAAYLAESRRNDLPEYGVSRWHLFDEEPVNDAWNRWSDVQPCLAIGPHVAVETHVGLLAERWVVLADGREVLAVTEEEFQPTA
jgi:hypothetical protein